MVTPATPSETPTETPAPAETPMPVLEVTWEEIKLPPLEAGFDGIDGFLVEDDGKTITVYRTIGPDWKASPEGLATRYSVWKTEDSGQTWKEIKEEVLTRDKMEQLGLRPSTTVAQDQNNVFKLAWEMLWEPVERKTDFYRLFLSTDNGESWRQLNFPSYYAWFDAYPETQQLFFLADRLGENGLRRLPDIRGIAIITADDGTIHLFILPRSGGRGPTAHFLRAIVGLKSPN